MTIHIKRWHGIAIAVFLVLVLAGIIIAALQGSTEAKAVGPAPATVAHATPTPAPTQGWWITVTAQWEDGAATPTLTSTEGCTPDSQYVADVTIPDGTAVHPGESFVKTWKVKNSGACDWGEGCELVFVSGEQMGGPESVPLPSVPAGEEADISLDLVAPSEPGPHEGVWRIEQGGEAFGTNLTVVIEVVAPGTIAPTMAPIATPTPDAAPAPGATPAGRWR